MAINEPITQLNIDTEDSGFYEGFSKIVAIGSKVLIGLLIVWAAAFPDQAGKTLNSINGFISANTGRWYMYIVAFYILVCVILALWPTTGRIRLGGDSAKPEFSNFSWFSMMFGAGIGIGMLTFATAEPLYHFATNPDVIKGSFEGSSAENVRAAYQWSFLHWGFSAWACYAIVGLSLAFFSYSRGLPLTIRSGLTPILGRSLEGTTGHIVDIVSVIATILGVAVTIGFGVSQFAGGLFNITGMDWLMKASGGPTVAAMIFSLLVVMICSIISALSGVGKGIKWLSNINMGLSFFVLAFFLIFGSTMFALKALFIGMWDYVITMPAMSVTVWSPDGTGADNVVNGLAGWQGGWTIFYWAWWIAFAPFVGLFLARISKGRTIREYVLGAMIVPSVMCFIWFAIVGGTAIDLELTGANGAISGAGQESQLFAMINYMLSPTLATLMSIIIVVLLLTYLVTSADSAVLIINTIAAAGDESQKGRIHIIVWGLILTLVIGVLLVAGGLGAIRTAMIIGALPFSLVMALMGLSLFKALIRDGMRAKHQAATNPAQ